MGKVEKEAEAEAEAEAKAEATLLTPLYHSGKGVARSHPNYLTSKLRQGRSPKPPSLPHSPMQLHHLIAYLETIAPPRLQESYDNAQLIVGDPQREITGVLTCLDSTEAVVAEAVATGCNVIVAHHPIVFRGLKSLTGKTYIERTVIAAIKHDVAIYAIHTNLDNVLRHGVNERIAQRLGLTDYRILAPKNPSEPTIGAGLIGELPTALSERAFLEMTKTALQAGVIKHTALLDQDVRTVAVCGGAGGFLLGQAIAAGAQAFVTADYKYHEFFDADGHLLLADVGHYESEQYTVQLLQELISSEFSNFAARCTTVRTNPVYYL